MTTLFVMTTLIVAIIFVVTVVTANGKGKLNLNKHLGTLFVRRSFISKRFLLKFNV